MASVPTSATSAIRPTTMSSSPFNPSRRLRSGTQYRWYDPFLRAFFVATPVYFVLDARLDLGKVFSIS
jgi:hypothetical protein